MGTLIQLFIDQLQDAHSAETQLVTALPRMARAASSPALRQCLEDHLEETQEHVKRLEEAGRLLNADVRGRTCAAMKGVLQEGEEMIALQADGPVKDAGLIAAAQKAEHYEIALYGCLCSWADELALTDVQHLLHDTLEQEKQADAKLTELAKEGINALARR